MGKVSRFQLDYKVCSGSVFQWEHSKYQIQKYMKYLYIYMFLLWKRDKNGHVW